MTECVLIELIALPAEQSRGRHNPRVVKRKMSGFPTKARNIRNLLKGSDLQALDRAKSF